MRADFSRRILYRKSRDACVWCSFNYRSSGERPLLWDVRYPNLSEIALAARARFLRQAVRAVLAFSGIEALPCSQAGAGDRKSTRLNSSHVKSSYAVVCLKKKK